MNNQEKLFTVKQANMLASLTRRGGARYADLLRGGFGGRLGKMRGAKKNIHEEFGGIPIDMHGTIEKGIAEEELKVLLTRLLTGGGLAGGAVDSLSDDE